MMPATIIEWIVSVAAAGGGAGFIAFQLFKKLGESWLDDRFKSQFEDLATYRTKK